MRVSCGPAVLAAIAVPALVGASATGGISLVGEFNPAEGAGMNSIGFSAISGEIFVHFIADANIHVYLPDGTFVRMIPKPYGGGNDDDMEFVSEAVDIGGTVVPAGTLLIFENDLTPPRIYAVDPSDGRVLAEQIYDMPGMGQWTGGAFHSTTGTCFITGWNTNEIHEIDTATGTLLGSFSVRPPGSPEWRLYYSDVDVLDADGQLYLVSSSQNSIRALSPTGEWGGDFHLDLLGIFGMSGVAFDDASGEAWVSNTTGIVYHLAGFPPPGCVVADLAPPLGVLDLNDVGGFVSAFLGQHPIADFAEPFGVWDLADILEFIDAFQAGCPE